MSNYTRSRIWKNERARFKKNSGRTRSIILRVLIQVFKKTGATQEADFGRIKWYGGMCACSGEDSAAIGSVPREKMRVLG